MGHFDLNKNEVREFYYLEKSDFFLKFFLLQNDLVNLDEAPKILLYNHEQKTRPIVFNAQAIE